MREGEEKKREEEQRKERVEVALIKSSPKPKQSSAST